MISPAVSMLKGDGSPMPARACARSVELGDPAIGSAHEAVIHVVASKYIPAISPAVLMLTGKVP